MDAGRALRILVVEDEPSHVEAIRRSLARDLPAAAVEATDSLAGCRAAIQRARPDVLLIDLNLPDGTADEILPGETGGSSVPVVVMTSHGSEARAVEVMRAGAADYVAKSAESLQDLGRRLLRVHREWEERKARREAEEALAASERRYVTLTRMSPVGIFHTDKEGATTFVNPRWCELAGLPAEAALGNGWLAAVHPEDRARIAAGWNTDPSQRQLMVEYRFLRPDGSIAWVMGQVAAETDEHGELVGYVGTITDITDRKAAEVAIERSRAELQTVYDHIPVMLCVVDADRRVWFGNRAFSELAERVKNPCGGDLVGNALACIHAFDDPRGCGFGLECARCKLRLAISDTFATGVGVHNVEICRTLLRQGENHEITLLASTALIPSPAEPRLLLCLLDVTELRQAERKRDQAEAALRQAQKLEAIGRLAGGVAHDFNNLLQAMMATVQTLRLRSPEPAAARAAEELDKLVKRGAGLTRQLLLFSRREQPRLSLIDLNELVRETTTLLRRLLPETVQFASEYATGELLVDGDPGQLQQVLVNLAVNARDAMPDGGRLVVRTTAHNDNAVVEVVDSGVGIPESDLERLFDPFFTTKEAGQGTGLGLAVVHGIVSLHGGHVEVESALGRGSTFRVVLPRRTAVPRAEPTEQAAPTQGRGERVLVVEDEAGAREGLCEILTLLDYRPTAVGSAEEAICLPDEPPFEVLLTDLLLPGISGGKLASMLLARWPALRVVIMSGYLEDERVRHEVPPNARFLQKPFDLETLGRELRTVLDSHPS